MCMMANKQINLKKQDRCGNKVHHFPHRLDADFPNEMKHLHIILLLCTPAELRAYTGSFPRDS